MINRRKFITHSAAAAIGTTALVTSVDGQEKQESKKQDSKQKSTPPRQARPPQIDAKLVRSFVGQSHGNLKGVKELVAKEPALVHASWDWTGGDFETGLGAASHVGNRDIANFLLDKGARIDAFAMAMLGHLDLIKAIVKTYPKTHAVPGPHGIPLLSHAIYGKKNADEVFEFLITAGANVNQTSNGGQTPLMAAAMIGRVEIVKRLLDAKADPNLKTKAGKTALDAAIKRKREAVVKILKPLTK